MKLLLATLLFAISYAQTGDKVVYGSDDRQDIYAREAAQGADDMWVTIGKQSVVALMSSSDLGTANSDGEFTLPTETLAEAKQMCGNEAFRDQLAAATCSATLVDSTHIVTAGHCVDAIPCSTMSVVFNFYVTGHDTTNGYSYQTITTDDVYSCSKYVRENNNLRDYAYIELDREVPASSGHVPVTSMEVDSSVRLSPGDQVVVIGFGSGLPMKIDTGATVFANYDSPGHYSPDYIFKANLDTFGGNSGSGVFKSDGTLIGIHFSGNEDYERQGDCQVAAELPGDAPGNERQMFLYHAMNELCLEGGDCAADKYCGNLEGGIGQCRMRTVSNSNIPMCPSDFGADSGMPVQCCDYKNECPPQEDRWCCSGIDYCTTDSNDAYENRIKTCPSLTVDQTFSMSSHGGSSCIHVSFPDDGSVDNAVYRSDLTDLGITAAGACPSQYDQTCEDSINTQASDLQTTLTGYGLTATVSAMCCANCNFVMCPDDGGAATCCDVDESCTNGDDDWCCDDEFYCSNDGAEYAEGRGGILCPDPLLDCEQCGQDLVAADLCHCMSEHEDCDESLVPDSCEKCRAWTWCLDVIGYACAESMTDVVLSGYTLLGAGDCAIDADGNEPGELYTVVADLDNRQAEAVSLQACASLCDEYADCVAFEFGIVAHNACELYDNTGGELTFLDNEDAHMRCYVKCADCGGSDDLAEEVSLEMTMSGVTEENKQAVGDSVADALGGVCTYVSLTEPSSSSRRRLTDQTVYMDIAVEDASNAVTTAQGGSFVSSLANMPAGATATSVGNVANNNDQETTLVDETTTIEDTTESPGDSSAAFLAVLPLFAFLSLIF